MRPTTGPSRAAEQGPPRLSLGHDGHVSRVSAPAPSVTLSQIGRAAHDLGLAGLLGGNLFGRLAMHPALARISDPSERGQVVNAAWHRYGNVNSLSLIAVTGGWIGARVGDARDSRLTPRERRLARAKDALVAATFITGAATAAEGVAFGRSAPRGAVPLDSGTEPGSETPAPAARRKRVLNALGALGIACEVALVAVDAALSQEAFRRPAARRLLSR